MSFLVAAAAIPVVWLKVGLVFLLVFGASGFFAHSASGIVSRVRLGQPDPERFTRIPWRIKRVIDDALLQMALTKEKDGWWHVCIFWGFIVLTIGGAEMILEGLLLGVYPGFSLAFLGPANDVLIFLQDILGIGILCAIVASFYRRLVIRPARLENEWSHKLDAMFCLVLIVIIVKTLILERAAEFAHTGEVHHAAVVSWFLSGLFESGSQSAAVWQEVNWWLHLVTILGFLTYLPYSKHFHIFASMPNVFFQNHNPRGRIEKLDVMDPDLMEFGVGRIEQFPWKDLLDLYACMECGRCQQACPAWNTGKQLNPRKLVWDLRYQLNDESGKLLEAVAGAKKQPEAEISLVDIARNRELVGDRITEEVLWACTACMGCITHCPVSIEHVQKIIDMRRWLTLMEGQFPPEVKKFFRNVEKKKNPYGMLQAKRAKWTKELDFDVPIMKKQKKAGEKVDYLFWVGCAGSFDARNQEVSRAFAKILERAGVSYAILGKEESCNGETARRLGNEYLWSQRVEKVVKTLDKYEFEKIVTACPHCFNTLQNEYPEYGGDYEVIHHSELISELMAQGRVPLAQGQKVKLAYHDSCYLGRGNDVYDAPRDALKRAGVDVLEAPRNREHGFCCGGGGGRVWMEEPEGKRISHERIQELASTGCDEVGVACPFCMTMLEDGVKTTGLEGKVGVREISEVVAAALAPVPGEDVAEGEES